jgi:dTMP kinase
MTKPRGLFLSFEGIDGAGKSTQIRRLSARLQNAGREVVCTVEPGGTRIGTRIREVLLDPSTPELSPTTELLLYFAARAQNVDQVIRPALERDAIVISDRFTDSSLAYQGAARGLGEDLVMALDRVACRGLKPDLTIFLDIDLATSEARVLSKDRLEGEPEEFRRRVREAYLSLVKRDPQRFRRIDGTGTEDSIESAIWEAVSPHV